MYLRYDATVPLTNASVPYIAQNVFRGNNIYDPDKTGTGGQPLGYDQIAPFFGRYCVTKSRINIQAVNLNANAATLTLIPSVGTLSIVDQSHARSLPFARQKIISSLNAGGFETLIAEMSTRTMFGQDRQPFDENDDVYNGSFSGTAPLREWEWTLYAQTLNAASLSVVCSVTIEYWFYCSYPVNQQPS